MYIYIYKKCRKPFGDTLKILKSRPRPYRELLIQALFDYRKQQ